MRLCYTECICIVREEGIGMLKGKSILLGVTGGIAAYKAADLCSMLVKQGCSVNTIMTANATEFISPIVFENLSGNRTATEMFDRNHPHQVEHIALSDRAELVVIAPATANIIAKLAHGLADDMLSTTVLACNCPKLIAPAMNTKMYENPVTQKNLDILRSFGWHVIEPASGRLACGTIGKGKLVPVEEIAEAIEKVVSGCPGQDVRRHQDLAGRRILVTAGPTREKLDPVRYITNHSSGKMGYAIAEAAAERGAEVTLISGPTALAEPEGMKVVRIETAKEMFDAVTSRGAVQDWIIKAAAVADFRPAVICENKIKKSADGSDLSIKMERTEDILGWLGEHKPANQILCGFSMETANMIENSKKKLKHKHLDMIAANNVKEKGAGFGVETNHLTLLTKDQEIDLPMMGKKDAAHALLDELLKLWNRKND